MRYQQSAHSIGMITGVLRNLITLAIADPCMYRFRTCFLECTLTLRQIDATIRRAVPASLDRRFDRHLAQGENVRSLFVALNDKVFANRETAVLNLDDRTTCPIQPACVMQSMRKALIQLLTELEYSTVL